MTRIFIKSCQYFQSNKSARAATRRRIDMFFQTAGIEINPLVPPLVAFCISFFTSMGGVSGAFLLLPFQMSFLGYTSPSVSATNQLFNIVAIPSGVYRYIREGRMVWPLTWSVVIGTIPGVFIGAIVRVAYLPDPKNFKLFAALVLLFIAVRMIRDLLGRKAQKSEKAPLKDQRRPLDKAEGPEGSRQQQAAQLHMVTNTKFTFKRIQYEYCGVVYDVPFWGILALCFVVGIIGGIYGIGGGAIVAPFFVSFFGLPVYTVAGAALMGTFMTSVAGVTFYQIIEPYYPTISIAPDWKLGLLFGVGGMCGMYCGARLQKFVPAKAIKWMLSAVIFFTAVKYILDFFR